MFNIYIFCIKKYYQHKTDIANINLIQTETFCNFFVLAFEC